MEEEVEVEIQRCTKEEQTATLLLDLTRLSVDLTYYYNIYQRRKNSQVEGICVRVYMYVGGILTQVDGEGAPLRGRGVEVTILNVEVTGGYSL